MIYGTRVELLIEVVKREKTFFAAIDNHSDDPATRVFLDSTEKLSDGLMYNPVYRFLWERGELYISDGILSWAPFSENGNNTYQIDLIDLKLFMAALYTTFVIGAIKDWEPHYDSTKDATIDRIDRYFSMYILHLFDLHCEDCYYNDDNQEWESFDGNPLYNILTTDGDFIYEFDDCELDDSRDPSNPVSVQVGPREKETHEIIFGEPLFKYALIWAFNYSGFLGTISLIRREHKEVN